MTDSVTFGDDGKPVRAPERYKPRVEAWAEVAVPAPPWVRAFITTKKLPPKAERDAPAPPETFAVRDARESAEAYGRSWRAAVREMTRAKGEAAKAIIVHGAESEIGRAARARGFDVDEEWFRLARLRDKGAPLVVKSFPPIDGSGAGQSIAAAERARAKSPLFDAQARAANDVDPMEFVG